MAIRIILSCDCVRGLRGLLGINKVSQPPPTSSSLPKPQGMAPLSKPEKRSVKGLCFLFHEKVASLWQDFYFSKNTSKEKKWWGLGGEYLSRNCSCQLNTYHHSYDLFEIIKIAFPCVHQFLQQKTINIIFKHYYCLNCPGNYPRNFTCRFVPYVS